MCQRCGRQIAPIASYAPVFYQRSRVHRHVQALGVLWIAYSLWTLLHWAIAVGVLAGVFTVGATTAMRLRGSTNSHFFTRPGWFRSSLSFWSVELSFAS
jgi:hypothetical protein